MKVVQDFVHQPTQMVVKCHVVCNNQLHVCSVRNMTLVPFYSGYCASQCFTCICLCSYLVFRTMPSEGWKKFSAEEERLAMQWFEEGVGPSEIAARLGRDKSTVTRHCVKRLPRLQQGRPANLNDAQVDFLIRRLHQLVVAAKGRYHVTAAILRKSVRMKVSIRSINRALRARNVYFRKLREKPLLTADDIASRKAFGDKFQGKARHWWLANIHAAIDGKHFACYLNAANRVRAAQHRTWGAYRSPGKGLAGAYVKPKRSLKHNTGAPSALIIGGVGKGRCLMWHCVPEGKWNSQSAVDMYKDSLAKKLQQVWPGKRAWNVLEDNDPTGFRSNAAVLAKEEVKIKTFRIPPRSPDLSVLDYAIWPEINKRMRKQELLWPRSKREDRKQYLARLRRTALRLPRTFIDASIGDMRRRCQRVSAAGGGYFEEGGN